MTDENTHKAAVVERVTGINAVTLRSYRRRGLLVDLGYEADGTTARYSDRDVVVFALATRLRSSVPMSDTDALAAAIHLRSKIEKAIEKRQPNVWVFLKHYREGMFSSYDVDAGTPLDWADLLSVTGPDKSAMIIGLSDLIQNVLSELYPEQEGSHE